MKKKKRWDRMPRRSIDYLRLPRKDIILLKKRGYEYIPDLLESIDLILDFAISKKAKRQLEGFYRQLNNRAYKPSPRRVFKESISLPHDITRAQYRARINTYVSKLRPSKSYEEIVHENEQKQSNQNT
jgi:hypothetical protein